MQNPIIEVSEVQRVLRTGGRDLHILRDISFSVSEEEWVALTGPSGSGKTTLLGILAGIDHPTSGWVKLGGVKTSVLSENRMARLRNEKIGVVFQSFHLISTMTAQENVEVPLYIHARSAQARMQAKQLLEQVGLGDRCNHRPYQLSGGEQQRVAIARALATNPRVLLADEPTGNLDSATSNQVLALLKQMRKMYGLTIVMVTHNPEVADMADRCLHLVDGKLAGTTKIKHADLLQPEVVV